jgi:hypothetical protein
MGRDGPHPLQAAAEGGEPPFVVTIGNCLLPLDVMKRSPNSEPRIDSLLILLLFALVLFCSPAILLWAGDDSLWYLPYVLWLVLIALGALVIHRRPGDRHGP